MVELREPVAARWTRWMLIGLGIGVAIAFVVFLQRNNDHRSAVVCEAAYQGAHSAADTAAIDVQSPPFTRGDVTKNLTCGELRRSDKLR